MKAILTFFISIFTLMNGIGQTKLSGKTYTAEIETTCKAGIGTLFKYRVLKFGANTVTSYYKIIADVAPKLKAGYEHMYDNLTKRFQWKIDKGNLLFEDCKEFGEIKIQGSKLIVKDNKWKKELEFTEQAQN